MLCKSLVVLTSAAIMSFSAYSAQPPVTIDTNVVNTPDVHVVSIPDVNITSLPDVHVSNLPSETSTTIIIEGEMNLGEDTMSAYAFSLSPSERIVLRHIACEVNSSQPGTKEFMFWLEGDSNRFILPITGFFERLYAPSEVPIPTNYFSSQILNEVSIGIEDFGEDIYLKGVTTANTGVGPVQVKCNLFVSEAPNN